MVQNSFRLMFDNSAYRNLNLITASAILDVGLFDGVWTDKLLGHIAIKAREESIALWEDWKLWE